MCYVVLIQGRFHLFVVISSFKDPVQFLSDSDLKIRIRIPLKYVFDVELKNIFYSIFPPNVNILYTIENLFCDNMLVRERFHLLNSFTSKKKGLLHRVFFNANYFLQRIFSSLDCIYKGMERHLPVRLLESTIKPRQGTDNQTYWI